jgi:hypothetical protein
MKTPIALIFALVTLLASAPAFADSLKLGKPAYAGPGCPKGSASVALSGDKKSLTVQFSKFIVEAGGSTGKTFDRKFCGLTIPVHVPQGISVSVLAVDFNGYNNLPAGAKSNFQVEYFFTGGTGPVIKRDFTGPKKGGYQVNTTLPVSSVVWSACGQDVNLRANSSIRVTTAQNKRALSAIDTANVKAAIVYKLSWKAC